MSAGAKADGDYQVVLRLLGEFVPPDTPVRAVTRDHCRQVAALLKRMPANAGKKPQFRGPGATIHCCASTSRAIAFRP
jgi:hypothetical protein